MKKVTLLSALLLLGTLCILPQAESYAQVPILKYNSAPSLPIYRGQTATNRIFVNDNVDIADVRIAVHAKTVIYSSLRLELLSPDGSTIVLKAAQPGGNTPWYGTLGTEDSYCLFRDGGVGFSATTAPNDMVFQPATPLSLLNGEGSQGWWTLKIIDEPVFAGNAAQQGGMWYAWSLMFNEVIQEPEQVLFEQILVGSNLTPQISGRDAAGAVIPNWNNDLDNACSGGLFTLGKNGDAFPFIITGIPGNIGDAIPPFVSPGRFEITAQIATNFPDGPVTSAFTSDIALYFGQAVENFSGSLPTPPASHPVPTVAAEWPTGLATTTDRLYPGPEDINGGVRLIACNGLTNLAPGDFGGMDVVIHDNALEDLTDATPCGGVMDPAAGICGEYVPEQSLASMNGGRAVNGLYYLTVYDTYGDDDASMKNSSGAARYGQVRVLYLRLRYLVGGGDTPSPNLHQGIAGPLLGVPTPGLIDGAVLGYRTSVGNTIPPYTYHGITPTQNPAAREPILYFTNVQKLYQANSIGYLHEELINTQNNSWSTVGNHGPLAWPGALDNNDFDATNAGNSSYADVIQINDGSYKIRHKIVQARYDSDPTDNEATGPEFHVTPNTFAYFKDKVTNWNEYTNPTNTGLQLPAYLGSGTGVAIAFTLFQFPSTTIASVDYLMDMLAGPNGPTPQSDWRVTIWPADNGLTGEPGGPPVARSTTISESEYIPGPSNWRTAPIYSLNPNNEPDLTSPSVDLAPGTYYVTFDVLGEGGQIPLYPYTFGQAPTLKDRILTYSFSDNFGPLGPASTLGSHLSYLSTDIASPPDLAWGGTNAPIMANWTGAVKLNMDYKNDFAVDYVAFDGTLGNESVSLPNAPFAPSFFVSSRTLQGGTTADCNVLLKIYQGSSWQPGDYSSGQVVTLNPYQTVQVSLAGWTPSSAGDYTVEAILSRTPQDYNPVNNMIKFHVLVSSTGAVIVKGNNAGSGKVNELKDLLANRGHDVTVVDANDASIAGLTGTTMYVVGNVNNSSLLTSAVDNGNQLAFVNDDVMATVANVDKVFQVERTSTYEVGSVNNAVQLRKVVDHKPIDVEPITIEYTSKEDLLSFLASNEVNTDEVQMITPSEESIEAMNADFSNLLPAVKNSPYGDLKYIAEKKSGIIYVAPTLTKSSSPVEASANTFALEQNYPNPFNPSTAISYTLMDKAQVSLRVLDVLGKEVASLVNDTKDAGNYTVTFNGVDNNGQVLPSGTYLYRIDVTTANGATFSNTKKMTLSK